ncbi:AraC family transcriptional regulator [Bradyrhizobium commune]|uniref:AraC family transcriptional regulator n=1 Tax=Bradyrhizobium commune TaxID=83627 RepID=A0A7S9H211_9BRAD|nr:AraC family transcriptional regulator [Bradyrhizobium commune]QPF93571.1 AraC family transcriptional regulator [Bradyrhizobium commune]
MQKARQHHPFPSSPPHPEGAKESAIVGLSERIYETTKLAALFDMLLSQGHPASEILKNVNLPAKEVYSSKARISLKQLLTACKNAVRLSRDPYLAYRIGASIHISTYGMYGFAILCCPDFRRTMQFATRYHMLAAPLAAISFSEENGSAVWSIEPNLHAATDPALYRFVTEMQIGIHISLMRDVMGPAFAPDEVCLAYPGAGDGGFPNDELRCSVSFAKTANKIVFRSTWLEQEASLGNRTTYPSIVALCDDLLDDLTLRIGIAGKVRDLLLADIATPPTSSAAARLLGMDDRSLRRKLRQQGLSYRGLLDELRAQIALKYLRTTRLSNDDIALALGFSDAANFRRAFHRWTNKAPSDIRAE